MSDDEAEYEYDYGSDEGEQYDYGSDGGEEGGDDVVDDRIEIENAFYEGDDLMNENPKKATELFEKVVQLESARGDQVKWRFKALQNLVILHFSLGLYAEMIKRYREMLQYMSSVTKNECTDAINAILDTVSSSTAAGKANVDDLSEVYEITLSALKSVNNERLWFNTNHKLARLYLESHRIDDVERLIAQLKLTCKNPDGSDDLSKSTYLLEIYCLEIQLCAATRNTKKLRQIYPKTLNLNAAVADPRIMGIIREEGGKMHMAEGNWDDAYNELYEAFRSYQEAGNIRAKDCLKYVVLASMLALSNINPFAAREAKVYQDDKEIVAMSDLRQALEANDLTRFEKTLANKQNRITSEPLLMKYIQPLRHRMREQVLLNLTRPYQKVTLGFLARELSLNESEVESLLVDMILDGRLSAHIDQINAYVLLDGNGMLHEDVKSKKLQSLAKWADVLANVSSSFQNRLV